MTKGFPFRVGTRSASKQLPRLRKHADMDGMLIGGIAGGGPGTGTERNPELPLSVSITASRTSGASPLAVFFEVEVEGTSAPARPFHHCNVHWDYGDPSSGTWAYGNSFLNSRDEDYAPMGSHVFEGAGPFTVTVTVTAPDGETAQDTVVISPTAEDSAYPTAQTICLSNDADFTGTPVGAINTTLSSMSNATFQTGYNAGIRRFLFKADDTFTITDFIALGYGISAGPVHIGRFGTGADPIITSASSNPVFNLSSDTASLGAVTEVSNDIRIVDLDIRNTSTGDCIKNWGWHQKSTILRCNLRASNGSAVWFSYDQGEAQTGPLIDRNYYLFMHDCVADDSVASTAMGNFAINGRYVSLKGNYKDGNSNNNHGVRLYFVQDALLGHNHIRRTGTDRDVIKWSGADWLEPTGVASTYNDEYMERIVIHDNWFEPTLCSSCVSIIKGNDTFRQERSRDAIIERNYIFGVGALGQTQSGVQIYSEKVTVRNNCFNQTDTSASLSRTTYNVRGPNLDTSGDSDWITDGLGQYVEVYNNSDYVGDARNYNSGAGSQCPINFGTGWPASNNAAYNNSSYRPLEDDGGGTPQGIIFNSGTAWTASNNGDSDLKWATNPYTADPPADDTEFENDGTELADAGIAVTGLFIDYKGTTRDSVPNQGAFE